MSLVLSIIPNDFHVTLGPGISWHRHILCDPQLKFLDPRSWALSLRPQCTFLRKEPDVSCKESQCKRVANCCALVTNLLYEYFSFKIVLGIDMAKVNDLGQTLESSPDSVWVTIKSGREKIHSCLCLCRFSPCLLWSLKRNHHTRPHKPRQNSSRFYWPWYNPHHLEEQMTQDHIQFTEPEE